MNFAREILNFLPNFTEMSDVFQIPKNRNAFSLVISRTSSSEIPRISAMRAAVWTRYPE